MTRDTFSSAVDQFYKAFKENDLRLLAQVVTDDFCVDLPVMLHVPLDPEYRGIEGFKKLMRDRDDGGITQTAFDEHERMIDVGRVAVFGRTEGKAGKEGRPFAHDWVHLFRFEGERIQLLMEYLDASEVSVALAPQTVSLRRHGPRDLTAARCGTRRQLDAFGRELAGAGYEQILKKYYTGIELRRVY